MRAWRARDPVSRFQRWLSAQGWWDEAEEGAARAAARREAIAALDGGRRVPKPPLRGMFEDVYDAPTPALEAQRAEVMAHVAAHPEACPADIPVR
jgi:2-oxoisovalerate dehydrogenase E1 component alpha subunit